MAAESFDALLRQEFPGATERAGFPEWTLALLEPLGFRPGDTLPCVGVCRDEICQPLVDGLRRVWGAPFDTSGLAGLPFAGRTGLSAALHHVPDQGGRRRFAVFQFTHIAFGPQGEPGLCRRPGLQAPSSACGALVGLRGDLRQGRFSASGSPRDPQDPERSLLERRVVERLPAPASPPDLLGLTRLVLALLEEDVDRLVEAVLADLEPEGTEPAYQMAVITGIQVHGPEGRDLVQVHRALAQDAPGEAPRDLTPDTPSPDSHR